MSDRNEMLRRLPSVDAVLAQESMKTVVGKFPRPVVIEGIRLVLDAKRKKLLSGGGVAAGSRESVSAEEVARAIEAWNLPVLRTVINATGVVIHTNLGRAPLSREVAKQVAEIASSYSNLELNLDSGHRGSRTDVIRKILIESTGAEDALVVNNNAAAVYLALRVLAAGREVVVSRGELVEIGGSFRIPDVMAASGARLVEVGTTNKTRAEDYRRALGPDTAMLLKVHRSNFEMVGFTEEPSLAELGSLAREHRLPMVMDMGWASLLDPMPELFGQQHTLKEALAGADLVCFSGDKMLGGPQCGILLGKGNLIHSLAKDPMARALRVDKLTLAALWSTLVLYRGGERGAHAIPSIGMLLAPVEELRQKAERLQAVILEGSPDTQVEVVEASGQVGGGAMPLVELPGYAVAVKPKNTNAEDLAARLRRADPPVLARVHQERVLLDVRTVLGEHQVELLADVLLAVLAG